MAYHLDWIENVKCDDGEWRWKAFDGEKEFWLSKGTGLIVSDNGRVEDRVNRKVYQADMVIGFLAPFFEKHDEYGRRYEQIDHDNESEKDYQENEEISTKAFLWILVFFMVVMTIIGYMFFGN